jgi:hypothetical protein
LASESGIVLLFARGAPERSNPGASRIFGHGISAVVGLAYVCAGPRAGIPGTRRLIVGPWRAVDPFPYLCKACSRCRCARAVQDA